MWLSGDGSHAGCFDVDEAAEQPNFQSTWEAIMTLSSLRICLGIFLLVEIQSPVWAGVNHIESGESAMSSMRIPLRGSQDPPPGPISTPENLPAVQQEPTLLLRARDENGAPVISAKVYLYEVQDAQTGKNGGPRLV